MVVEKIINTLSSQKIVKDEALLWFRKFLHLLNKCRNLETFKTFEYDSSLV